jgi:hypothetical protein
MIELSTISETSDHTNNSPYRISKVWQNQVLGVTINIEPEIDNFFYYVFSNTEIL